MQCTDRNYQSKTLLCTKGVGVPRIRTQTEGYGIWILRFNKNRSSAAICSFDYWWKEAESFKKNKSKLVCEEARSSPSRYSVRQKSLFLTLICWCATEKKPSKTSNLRNWASRNWRCAEKKGLHWGYLFRFYIKTISWPKMTFWPRWRRSYKY